MNKDMFSKCAFRLKTWAQGVLEAKVGCIRRLRVVTTVKSKKGCIRKMKYGVMIPLNPNNIEEVDRMAGNTKWLDAFFLECGKLTDMHIFREMTELEWKSGLFQFCPLHFVIDVKHNGRHKVHCIAGRNRI